MGNMLKVSITSGENKGTEVELDLVTSLTVGRSRKSDIRLRDADVSGSHFEFVRSSAGCCVKDLSRNGLKVDGVAVGEGEIAPIRQGSVIEVGVEAKLTVDEIPDASVQDAPPSSQDETPQDGPVAVPQAVAGTDFFDSESDRPEAPQAAEKTALDMDVTMTGTPVDDAGDGATRGDFEDALTEVEDGETQEMKTRVGSMEEISARKRMLDRAAVVKRWKFAVWIGVIICILSAVWFVTGSRRHVTDAEGPFLPSGEWDLASHDIFGEDGRLEMYLEFPRDDRMKVAVSDDSNTVDIVSFLGVDRDVPFHMEFKRWHDSRDLRNSLEASFESRIRADSEAGMSFAARDGSAPRCEFFDDAFPGYCEKRSQRGTPFVRTEFTRSMRSELWHGVVLYLRNGDMIYQLRTEIPDVYWKRGGYRLTGEPHMGIYDAFSRNQWDSPGAAGLVGDEITNEQLLLFVRRELSAERVCSWPTVCAYIDTLLARNWSEHPMIRKMALSYHRTFMDKLENIYNERKLAFTTAKANANEKLMKSIFLDTIEVFGAMTRDRRSSLVYNPEVWPCHLSR